MADLSSLTKAFVAEAMELVDHSKKVFGKALRFPGWDHTFGNLMKLAAKGIADYPTYLEWCRALCRLFPKRHM